MNRYLSSDEFDDDLKSSFRKATDESWFANGPYMPAKLRWAKVPNSYSLFGLKHVLTSFRFSRRSASIFASLIVLL